MKERHASAGMPPADRAAVARASDSVATAGSYPTHEHGRTLTWTHRLTSEHIDTHHGETQVQAGIDRHTERWTHRQPDIQIETHGHRGRGRGRDAETQT